MWGGPASLATPCGQTQSTKNRDPTRGSEVAAVPGAGARGRRASCEKREHRCLPANYGRRRRRGEWVRTLGSRCQLVSTGDRRQLHTKGWGGGTGSCQGQGQGSGARTKDIRHGRLRAGTCQGPTQHPGCLENAFVGLSWRLRGKGSACQCRRHGFDPWSGKIPPHAAD